MVEAERGLLSVEAAIEAGLPFDEPQRRTCPHCDRPLEPMGISLNGRVAWVAARECACDGARAQRRDRELAQERQRASMAAAEAERRMDAAGIPRRFRAAEVDDRRILGYIAAFGEAKGGGLYIHGKVGRGKTHAASALAMEFLDAGYLVVFTTAKDMLEAVKSTFDGRGDTASAMGRFSGCDVLVIDDLGKEDATEWSLGTVFAVVNARYEAMLPTILTSNYAPDELEERLARKGERVTAEAIASRIAEVCAIVRLPGPDRRRSG